MFNLTCARALRVCVRVLIHVVMNNDITLEKVLEAMTIAVTAAWKIYQIFKSDNTKALTK